MHRFKGKSAFVTGGTAGIGRAIAEGFAREGANVVILGTNEERAQRVVSAMEDVRVDQAQKFGYEIADVASKEQVQACIDRTLERFSSVDILVNNAGITRDNLLMKMGEEDWDLVIDVNLKSVYNTVKALARSMLKMRKGVILNISSVSGLIGNAGQANYAAAKSGMIGLTKSLAKEFATRGIRVNCIAPGYIDTDMTAKLSTEVKENILKTIPLARMGEARDIAEAALFLASDAASYITGQLLAVDGGMVM